MYIIVVILIWFLAPIVELGVIIGLAIANDNKKRKIRELTGRLERNQAQGPESRAAKQVLVEEQLWASENGPHKEPIETEAKERNKNDIDSSGFQPPGRLAPFSRENKVRSLDRKIDFASAAFQGTAALIIGVVLVVLAGAVFATTTWEVLPDICKVVGVLLFAGLFFGTSALAERKLKLRRTGWAFYTLGCVFLFLAVLAIGYFEILGSGFVLSGLGRWRVLFAGSLMTEIAWCCGYKRFRDRVYTISCLWGITVCMTFLLLALGLGYFGFINGLMIYAGILTLCSGNLEGILDTDRQSEVPKPDFGQLEADRSEHDPCWNVGAVIRIFAAAHFWCVSLLMIFRGIWGAYTLGTVLALAIQLLVTDRLTAEMAAGADPAAIGASGNSTAGNGTGGSSMRKKLFRWLIPGVMFLLFMNARGWFNLTFEQKWDWDVLMLVYLTALSAWDLARKERFWLLLTIVGVMSQAFYWIINIRPLPMLLVLAGYLYLKRGQVEEEERSLYLKDSCLLMMLGLYLCADHYAGFRLQAIMPSLTVYTVGYAAVFWKKGGFRNPAQKRDKFWDVLAAAIPSIALYFYYAQAVFKGLVWYLIPCMAAFAVCYGILYLGERSWPHAILALFALPLPFILLDYRVFPEDWFYGGFAAVSLVLGLFARRYGAVVRRKEDPYGWSVDWYHILIGPTFVFLALISGSIVRTQVWMSVYLILLALYLLQYAALPRLRKFAATSALAILAWAWWVQKLISWPEWLELGMQLLPVAGMAAILPFIWGRNRGTMWLGRSVHTACLFLLTADALMAGDVSRALVLEAVCLAVFLGSHARRSVWWMRISGAVLVTVALYMTKAFWLSISWWVYLLAAGLGLILFAAFGEKRRQEKEKNFDR